jgi:hypothetical protein
MQIFVAWAEKTKLVPTGRQVMRDMNWFPEFRADWEGRAAAWKWDGTDADIAKAKEFAKADGLLVLTFPANEKNAKQKAEAIAVQKRHDKRQ